LGYKFAPECLNIYFFTIHFLWKEIQFDKQLDEPEIDLLLTSKKLSEIFLFVNIKDFEKTHLFDNRDPKIPKKGP